MNFKPHMYMKQNCKSSIKGPTYPRNMHAYWRKIIIWSLHSGVFRIQERGAKSGSLGNGSTPMGSRGRAPVDDLGAKSSRSCGILYAFWSQQNSNICVTCRKFRSQKIADVRDARGGASPNDPQFNTPLLRTCHRTVRRGTSAYNHSKIYFKAFYNRVLLITRVNLTYTRTAVWTEPATNWHRSIVCIRINCSLIYLGNGDGRTISLGHLSQAHTIIS